MIEEPADACDLLCLDLPRAERIRAGLPDPELLVAGAARGRALADPTRLGIATALRAGDELCVCDLAWVVGQAQNLVSHHLRQLKVGGLVTSRRDGKLVMYRLTDPGAALMGVLLGADLAATVGAPGTRNLEA